MKNKADKIKILGIEIDNLDIDTANNHIKNLVQATKDTYTTSHYVVKPYVEFMTKSHGDSHLRDILNDADLVLPDGISLQWASSYIYGNPRKAFLKTIRSLLFWIHDKKWRTQVLKQNHGGPNQTIPLLKLAEQHNWKIGILGGKQSEQKHRTQNLTKIFPGINKLYCWNGYYNQENNHKMIEEIRSKKLDVLFVAMGFPKQEEFIYQNRNNRLAKVLIGEGGTFDYDELGGSTKRAPKRIQRLGLEWAWRITVQPKRILRLFSILRFIVLIKHFSRATKTKLFTL